MDYSSDSSSMFSLICTIAIFVGYWKVFEKADIEGWKGIIPIYNTYKMVELSVGNGWLFLLYCIPIVNIGMWYYQAQCVAKSFGKSSAFGWGLMLVPVVFYPLLGFGSDSYYGPKGVNDYRDDEARGATTVNFDVVRNDSDDDNTVDFNVE